MSEIKFKRALSALKLKSSNSDFDTLIPTDSKYLTIQDNLKTLTDYVRPYGGHKSNR